MFIYEHIIIPLLRHTFYCYLSLSFLVQDITLGTEKHSEGNKIFYFRKPVWKLISKLAISSFE